eukprot:g5548.t1
MPLLHQCLCASAGGSARGGSARELRGALPQRALLAHARSPHFSQRVGGASDGFSCGYRCMQMIAGALGRGAGARSEAERSAMARALAEAGGAGGCGAGAGSSSGAGEGGREGDDGDVGGGGGGEGEGGAGGAPWQPRVLGMQQRLEQAWVEGFDPKGAAHFRGAVAGTKKLVGATECAALLRHGRVRAALLDFDNPQSGQALARDVLEWVWAYFEAGACAAVAAVPARAVAGGGRGGGAGGDGAGGSSVVSSGVRWTSRPPLHLQWTGHSVAVVGIARTASGAQQLLIFNPACSGGQLHGALRRGAGWQKLVVVAAKTLAQKRQLQIVAAGAAVGALARVLSNNVHEQKSLLMSEHERERAKEVGFNHERIPPLAGPCDPRHPAYASFGAGF